MLPPFPPEELPDAMLTTPPFPPAVPRANLTFPPFPEAIPVPSVRSPLFPALAWPVVMIVLPLDPKIPPLAEETVTVPEALAVPTPD